MTHTTKLATIAITALCLPAFAMGQGATEMDANGDGMLSMAELQAVYPDMTADQFATVDTNADGSLDATEVAAATDAGLLPAAPTDG